MTHSIYLKKLEPSHASTEYVQWMNDPNINMFLESRFIMHTRKSIEQYIKYTNETNNYLFGIFLHSSNKHIGNIKIADIDYHHLFACIGIIIGDAKEWGKGYATEAIYLASKFAFDELNINLLIAGIYKPNIASLKAFTKVGYTQTGIYKNKFLLNNKYCDEILFQCSANELKEI